MPPPEPKPRSHLDPFTDERGRLVRRLQAGVRDRRILAAFAAVPRHEFVLDEFRAAAYLDRALSIGQGQTISQPSMIARMLEELRCEPDSRVLEVGSGSGYALALLSHLSQRVTGIERLASLAERARATLARIGIENVTLVVGDGSRGHPKDTRFDRILVSAGAQAVPLQLMDQLAMGGRIVAPIGTGGHHVLQLGIRGATGIAWERSVECVFVPLIEGS